MKISGKTRQGMATLKVEGEMTIYTAQEMKAGLARHLDKAREMEIDLAQVHEIDSAGMQLLILLKREAAQRAIPLRFVAHSAAVTEVIDLFGLAAYFGDPILLQPRDAAH